MARLNRFLFLAVIFAFVFALQAARLFEVGGVGPNLILITALLVLFFPIVSLRLESFLWPPLALAILLTGFLFMDFWSLEILVLIILVSTFYLLRKFLTGDTLLDFIIGILTITPLFYLISGVVSGVSPSWGFIILELLYNLFLGTILWLVLSRIKLTS